MEALNKIKRLKLALEATTAMNMLEPFEYYAMYTVILLLFFLALYGCYWFLPSHLRHLAYVVGLSSTDL
uniref:Uncharacterized protein n=1 Tax=Amphimedon queenslandica TaxID=400682 RepID=A0A1X7UP16_AMPQE